MAKRVEILLMIALAATAAAPAVAQTASATPAQPTTSAKPANSGDKIVCERQEEIGSRLSAKKVCKTAAQWQDERRQERNDFEKIQQVVNQSPSR